jgi:hypothetical protein
MTFLRSANTLAAIGRGRDLSGKFTLSAKDQGDFEERPTGFLQSVIGV